MEQQMALFAEIEDMQTGEKRRSALIPLTDAVMTLFGPTTVPNEYDRAEVIVKRYGEKLGRLVDQGRVDIHEMYKMLAAYADGISTVQGFEEWQSELLRNACFTAADCTMVSLQKEREAIAC